jgi:hypothetical protein
LVVIEEDIFHHHRATPEERLEDLDLGAVLPAGGDNIDIDLHTGDPSVKTALLDGGR